MNINQIRILNILEEISHHNSTSQRELSKKLNISLGLVNTFVKRLAKKGYFKVSTLPNNRLRYILTPKGATEKTRLTYEYLKYSLKFYKIAKRRILGVLQGINDMGLKKVVLYGSGELAEIALIMMRQTKLEVVAVVDEAKTGEKFMEKKLSGIDAVGTMEYDIIIVTELESGQDIEGIANTLKVSKDHILTIH